MLVSDQVGLHQLLNVLVLGLLQGLHSNNFAAFQGHNMGLCSGQVHMQLSVEPLGFLSSGDHLSMIPGQVVIPCIQGE